jgi:two-component system, NarL family, invasion response regulator UvrY
MAAIRVFICDDAPSFRDLLRLALEQDGDLEVVGEADDGSQLQAVGEAEPDVVLLDVSMPGRGGLDVLAELRELAPRARVIVLSSFSAEEKAEAAAAAGADRYLDKRESFDRIRQVVREVAAR